MYEYCTISLDRSQVSIRQKLGQPREYLYNVNVALSLICHCRGILRGCPVFYLLLQATQEAFQLHDEAFVRSLANLLALIVCLDFED